MTVSADQGTASGADPIFATATANDCQQVDVALPPLALEKTAQGLGGLNIAAEEAKDAALRAQNDSATACEVRVQAWCGLAAIGGVNPYRDAATDACTRWRACCAARIAYRQRLDDDAAVLARFLALQNTTDDDKKAVLDRFLQIHGESDDKRVSEARSVRGALDPPAPDVQVVVPKPKLTTGEKLLALLWRMLCGAGYGLILAPVDMWLGTTGALVLGSILIGAFLGFVTYFMV